MQIERFMCAFIASAALLLTPDAARVDASASEQSRPGILLLAHGGSAQWNDNVRALAARVDKDQPTEVAFGMARRANIQTAVDALVARGVTEIVAVPLFVSSYSSVVTSTEYFSECAPRHQQSSPCSQRCRTAPPRVRRPRQGTTGHTTDPADGRGP